MTSPGQSLCYHVWPIANFIDHCANPLLGRQRDRSLAAKRVRNGAFADTGAGRNISNRQPSRQRTFAQDIKFANEMENKLGRPVDPAGVGKICQTGLMQTIAGFWEVVNYEKGAKSK